jgi:hypothetical protein
VEAAKWIYGCLALAGSFAAAFVLENSILWAGILGLHAWVAFVISMTVQELYVVMPEEIWALERVSDGRLMPPIDDDLHGHGVFMAWPTKEQADQGLLYQISAFALAEEYRVVRIK